MLITGKTSDENRICFHITHLKCVKNGRLVILSVNMMRDVHYRATVASATDGKNRFFTLWYTKQYFVTTKNRNILINPPFSVVVDCPGLNLIGPGSEPSRFVESRSSSKSGVHCTE